MTDPHQHYWPKRNPGYSTVCYECGEHLQIEEQVAYIHPRWIKHVWVVSYDHWGQDGITIVAVCATEQAAKDTAAQEVFKLDYKVERWDVTR